jgi:hypothetical protein
VIVGVMFFMFISFTNSYMHAYLHTVFIDCCNRIFLKLLGVEKVDKKPFANLAFFTCDNLLSGLKN